MQYLVNTPWWLKKVYPSCIWDLPTEGNVVYLTFDDGPHPTITPWVIAQLAQYNMEASFFCIGDNVRKHEASFNTLKASGHTIGNHTYNHLNGWKSKANDYAENIVAADDLIGNTNLFRPPYGKITRQQIKGLQQKKHIVMWNVLSGDFDNSIDANDCYNNCTKHTKPGSIIVFHDSEKAWPRLEHCLPKYLQWLQVNKFTSKAIHLSS
jgi:peptidoglycan-N-acetylglucosamine deacetylase